MGAKARLEIIICNNYMNKNTNPCTDFLSNKDYLEHMIPHHQVAIDMCNLMKPISKSKTIQYPRFYWDRSHPNTTSFYG